MPGTLLRNRLLVGSFTLSFIALTQTACTSILGDFNNSSDASAAATSDAMGSGPDATSSSGGGDSGPALGTACTAGTQCGSGFCADGVCCDNACAGTCERCNQPATLGTCSPIAANTDPQMECVMIAPPVIDAGTGDAATTDAGDAASTDGGLEGGASEAGIVDAGVSDASSSDAAAVDGGVILGYNPPDGGVATDMTKCAGACDGKGGKGGGSCVYPDGTKSCGTQFCNTTVQKAGFVCDSAGHCALSLTNCTDYSCSSTTNTCGTSCSKESDCLATDYCGADSLCHLKKGNGVPCGTDPTQCGSGFCDNGVCCNTDCSPTAVPGGNCDLNATQAGSCACSQCATGPCAVYYHDGDGDGYGDPATTAIACAAGPTPAHYVTNNTDCDDADPNVNPAQTGYYSTPSLGTHTYDYNCDGTLEGTPSVYQGASCGTCGTSCAFTTACASGSTAQSYLSCAPRYIIYNPPVQPVVTASQIKTLSSPQPDLFISTCFQGATSGFTGTAACGQPASFTYCYTGCNGSVDYGYASTQPFPCH